jgi:hypothetical protein
MYMFIYLFKYMRVYVYIYKRLSTYIIPENINPYLRKNVLTNTMFTKSANAKHSKYIYQVNATHRVRRCIFSVVAYFVLCKIACGIF